MKFMPFDGGCIWYKHGPISLHDVWNKSSCGSRRASKSLHEKIFSTVYDIIGTLKSFSDDNNTLDV